MNQNFYARFPMISNNNIYFISQNRIYKHSRDSKNTKIILCERKEIKHLACENENIVFVKEGDIYLLNTINNELTRLTYAEDIKIKPLWLKNNKLTYISNEHEPFWHATKLYELDLKTKETKEFPYNSVYNLAIDENEDKYIQKDEYGYLFWKNYQGGSRGKIYKNEKELIELPGQSLCPMVYKDRIYFIYEENEDTNICSCTKEGKDFQKHTNHKQFKLFTASINKNEIIYMQIGEIYIFNIETEKSEKIEINIKAIEEEKKQPLKSKYITSIDSNKQKIICAIRGNVFEKNLYSGSLKQISEGLRYVHTGFFGAKTFAVKEGRETEIVIFDETENKILKLVSQKIHKIQASKEWFAYSNHKGELNLINENEEIKQIAKADEPINYFEWSKDGSFLVYEFNKDNHSSIVLYSIEQQKNICIIEDEFTNTHPTIDPDNRFIAFLSNRNVTSIPDEIKFDYTAEVEENAYYIPLKEGYDMLTPWENEDLNKEDQDQDQDDENAEDKKKTDLKESKNEKENKINFESLLDISNKITQIPIKHQLKTIVAIKDHIIGETEDNEQIQFSLKTLTEESKKEEGIIILGSEKKTTIKIHGEKIIISPILEKIDEKSWRNITFTVNGIESKTTLKEERTNIFEELTWFMEEFFWSAEKSEEFKIKAQNYRTHIAKAQTEEELLEILNQVQSEMKTSHAYIKRKSLNRSKGYLGVKTDVNGKIQNFIISTQKKERHPILGINKNIKEGAQIQKINNKKTKTLEENLIGSNDKSISVEINNKEYDIKPINYDTYKKWQYENWVQNNEKYIQSKSKDIGYLHIPSMGGENFINFMIQYKKVCKKKAIIIDVRNNTGGHVSTLILEQLTKQKTGEDQPRHSPNFSIPYGASEGKYVLLINAHTASDGEIFAENFKRMNLGKVIGERTWGGVVGIMPRYKLINNITTTQPEFATIFKPKDKTKEVENYGVEPDIQISNNLLEIITPIQDNQLNKAIEEVFATFLANE